VLQQFGSPDDLKERPANLFVAGFIGEPPMNIFDAALDIGDGAPRLRVTGADGKGGDALFSLALPASARWAGFAAGQTLKLGLRPHRIRVGDASAGSLTRGVQATVVSNHWLGDQSHLGLALGDAFVIVVTDRDIDAPRDARIAVHVPVEAVHVFDAASGLALFHGTGA
jgi:multiple sugar transport system ATP-binding protein